LIIIPGISKNNKENWGIIFYLDSSELMLLPLVMVAPSIPQINGAYYA